MKKLTLILISIFAAATLVAQQASAQAFPIPVRQGGTGWGFPGGLQINHVLIGNGLSPVATSSGLTFSNSKLTFTYGSSTALTLSGLAGSGTKCVQVDNNGFFTLAADACGTGSGGAFAWTVSANYNSTSTTLGFLNGFFSTASSTLSGNVFLPALSQGVLYTGTNGQVNTVASSSLNVGTATALAANGSNCSAGSFPLGIDASGAVETCTDAWTEAENTSAGYVAGTRTLTVAGTANQITSSAGAQDLTANRTWTLSIPTQFNIQQASTTIFSALWAKIGATASTTIGLDGAINTPALTVENTGAGDANIIFGPTSNEWIMGYDDTDKTFAIASSTVLGTLNKLTISKSGVVTFAYSSSTAQSSFANASSTQWIGGGLGSDCDGDTQALGWDATTLQFTCGDDDNSGSGAGDSFTHPAAGQSATTSLMLLYGNASSTGFSANYGFFDYIKATSTTATSTFLGPVQLSATANTNKLYVLADRPYPASLTGGGLVGINNSNINPSQALSLSSTYGAGATSRVFSVQNTNSAFDQELVTLQSASWTRTNLGIVCSNAAQGCVKITKNGGAALDPDVAAISTDIFSTTSPTTFSSAMGWFHTSTQGGSTGNIMELRNNLLAFGGADAQTTQFALTGDGKVGVGTTSPWAYLSVNPTAHSWDATAPWFAIGSTTGGTKFVIDNTGTTTSVNGFNITAGCFAKNGVCISGSGSGLTSYDAWTHPAAGISATTSLIQLFGQASSTLLSANQAWFGGTATTSINNEGLLTVGGGFVSQASSTVVGLFRTTAIGLGKAPSISIRNDILTDATYVTGNRVEGDLVSRTANSSFVTGDAQVRYSQKIDGVLGWGDGTSAVDTNLYRSAANTLTTDDLLTFPYSSSTIYSSFITASTTNLSIGGDSFNELVGSGLTVSGSALTVDNVTAAMLNAEDFGSFTCNGTSCTLDNGSVDLTTKVTGILPIANGGTNASSFATNSIIGFDGTRLIATGTVDRLYTPAIVGTTTATSTLAGPLVVSSSKADKHLVYLNPLTTYGSASANPDEATLAINNTANTISPAIYVNSDYAGVPSNPQVIVRSTDAAFNQGSIWVLGASTNTGGNAFGLKVQDGNPDIELIESDQVSPAGKYEIDGNNDLIRINGRNAADDSFATIAWFSRFDKSVAGGGGRFCLGCGFSDLASSMFNLVGTTTQGLPYFTVSSASTTALTGNRFIVTKDWKVGIGSTTPFARLGVNTEAGDIQGFAVGSSTKSLLSVSTEGFGTTTVAGLNVSATATSTSNVGFNITNGCFAINGVCVSGGGGAGTVTSVAQTVPTGLTISGSPVTTSGTLAIALDTGYVIPLQSTLDAKAEDATTLTIAGTANQITSSAGAQDISTNRTWTLSIPSQFNIQQASTTIFSAHWAKFGATASTTIDTAGNVSLPAAGTLTIPALTSALLLTDANGLVAEYGGTSCTNQFVRSISALGVATCATVDISADTNLTAGTNITLTGDDLSVDDVFLLNTGDTATGNYTFDTDTFFIDSTGDEIGIGTITPNAKLEVMDASPDYSTAIFKVSTSTAAIGQLFNVFSTTTTQALGSGPNAIGMNPDSGTRVGIGTISQNGYGGLLDQLVVRGRINTEGWNNIQCDKDGSAGLTGDTSNVCASFQLQEDTAMTWRSIADATKGYGYNSIEVDITNANSGGGFFGAGSSGGTAFMIPATSTPVMEVDARMRTPSANLADGRYIIGFSNLAITGTAFEVEPTAGCYFMATTTANWQAICRTAAGSNATQVDTGVASSTSVTATGGWRKFRIELDASHARFYIRATQAAPLSLVADISTNYPSTIALHPGLIVSTVTSLTTAMNLDLMHFRVWWRDFLPSD